MDTFDFPNHTIGVEYPASSAVMQFGFGWEFASKPKGPDQRIFTLSFPTMVYYLNDAGNAYNLSKNADNNAALLEKFYQDHRLYEVFLYPHQAEGNLKVRFKDPVKLNVKLGGLGTVEAFQIRLTEQP